jgi:hypothetical protein
MSRHRRFRPNVFAAGSIVALLLVASCGSSSERAATADGTSAPLASDISVSSDTAGSPDSTSSSPTAPATQPPAPSTTRKPVKRPPGPPSPNTPVAQDIDGWHDLLDAMTPESCGSLVDQLADKGWDDELDHAIIRVYLGAAEGCLGRTDDARTHLDEARSVLETLPDELATEITPACRLEELLQWAYETYLDSDVTIACPSSSTTDSTTDSEPGSSSETLTAIGSHTTGLPSP